jgi:polynucleotide kinase-phosphatase
LRRSLHGLGREGFHRTWVLRGADPEVEIVRTPLWSDRRAQRGPFDVIGDVHGCYDELSALLAALGYVDGLHPAGRRLVFVGDYVDRGPKTPDVLRLVMRLEAAGRAICVPGNHDVKLVRKLGGRDVQITHGLAESLAQLGKEPPEFRAQVEQFLHGLVSHYVLDDGKLVVAHAGITERYQGRASGRVRSFCLYGDTTGETDEFGLPVRYPWASDYRGKAIVAYGHTPVPAPEWINNTLCLDTGCVFGGRLTALRYPERDLVWVPAAEIYYAPSRPFPANADAVAAESDEAARRDPDVLDIDDVAGRRVVETRYHGRVSMREENAAAALEVMSRFALDPRWLLYLPPTMSPVATTTHEALLEHPGQAFDAYRADGVDQVICEEKHMGSRAVVVLPRGAPAAERRFGAPRGATGAVYTRTGRPFFDPAMTEQLLLRLRAAAEAAGIFGELSTDWLILDAELLPWSAKALDLLKHQYAAVGAAARTALPAAAAELERAEAAGLDVASLLASARSRLANARAFTEAYRRYCWPTDGLAGIKVAPFQILASDRATYHDRPHSWHLDLADRLVAADADMVAATRRQLVDTTDPQQVESATQWWEELTTAGGEGMVVKPAANLSRGRRGLVQPGLKVRGREYLRIIYGPDYTEPANLERLRMRGLGHKRSLAAREYALGLEALERAARGEPLWRVHECVFAVLALESEPVDPRL